MTDAGAYGHAIISVVIYAVIAQVLNAATGIRKGSAGLSPGDSPDAAYGDADYRLDRTYMNTVEMGVFYFALVFAAIIAGANPLWTNILASAGMVLRIAANVVYLRGLGAPYGGLRTRIIILASLCNLGLAGVTLAAVF